VDSKVVGRSHWLAIIAAFLGWMFDGFEMGLYPLVARPAVREMLEGAVQEELAPALRGKSAAEAEKLLREELEIRVGKWYSWFVAVFLFGAALGGFVFGWLGDVLGRTKAMILSVLCYSLFTGAAGLSTLPWHMAVLRFVAALGMGGEWSLGVALIMELWPSAARPVLAGVIGAAANFGFLLIAAVGYVLSGYLGDQPGAWRWLVLVGAVPALLTLFIRFFVPESERWRRAVKEQKRPVPWEVFYPGMVERTMVGIVVCAIPLLATWGAVQWQTLWVEQVAQQTLGQVGPRARNVTQMVSAFGACVGTFMAAVLGQWVRRRTMYVALCAISLGSALWMFRPPWLLESLDELGVISKSDWVQSYSDFIYVHILVVGLTSAAFYGWIPLYLPELFPTRVRATGQGLCFNFGRIFAGLGNLFLTAPLLRFFGGDYASAAAAVTTIYVLGMLAIWLAPETHGQPLPD